MKLKTLESVTHFKDTYKLNIRRLFKEYLTPGVPEDKIICLDKVLDGKFFCHQRFFHQKFWSKIHYQNFDSFRQSILSLLEPPLLIHDTVHFRQILFLSMTVHFGPKGAHFELSVLDCPFWPSTSHQWYHLLFVKCLFWPMTVYFVLKDGHFHLVDRPLWLKRPSTLAHMTVTSTSWTVHFEPDSL